MSKLNKIFIINAHVLWQGISPGKLNKSLVEKATTILENKGYSIKTINIDEENWNINQEIENHEWADYLLIQSPVNWFGFPWKMKKYMDEVYTAGMAGRLCNGDGRTRKDPTKQYGTGGTQYGKQYMISLTFNAPKQCFDDENQYLYQGKGVEDLMLPIHANYKFHGMKGLPTFACYDVIKNPNIENDFIRFEKHLNQYFPQVL